LVPCRGESVHVEHIYTNTGCFTRAEASLFALQQRLLDELRAGQR